MLAWDAVRNNAVTPVRSDHDMHRVVHRIPEPSVQNLSIFVFVEQLTIAASHSCVMEIYDVYNPFVANSIRFSH